MKIIKRFTALITAMAMVMALMPMLTLTAGAAEFTGASGGEGTENNPYEISTLTELEALRDYINAGNTGEGEFFKLTADIDMSEKYGADIDGEEVSWTPIGNGKLFNGTFDGDGHKIAGLYSNAPESGDQGLFGYIGPKGKIQNLGVVDGSVTGRYSVGGIAGENLYGTITNCYNIGAVTGNHDVGGIAGNNYGTIENSYNIGAVTGSYDVGGIAGGNPYGTITNCYNTGAVTGDSTVGGIVGNNLYGTTENSYYIDTCGAEGEGNSISADDFKNADTFDDWDFDGTWEMNNWLDRPILVSNPETEIKGDGKSADTAYEIPSLAALELVRDYINEGNTGEDEYFKLTADIDMSEKYNESGESWTPIGNSKAFTGIFDGDGHTITGLYLYNEDKDDQGLFRYVGSSSNHRGWVKNLGVVDVSVTGKHSVGSVVGCNYGTVENCYSTGNGSVIGGNNVGGVVGWSAGTVENCYNTSSGTLKGNLIVGGVVGRTWDGAITKCYNTGTVIGNEYVGGIVGDIVSNGTVKNCYYLNGCVTSGNSHGTRKTEDKFKSGEVAWLLQNGQSEQVWGQNLKETKDAYPVLTGNPAKKVLKVTFATSTNFNYDTKYTNYNCTVELPENNPSDTKTHAFCGWSTDKTNKDFDETTPVTQDISVYALKQEMYGGEGGTLSETYGYENAITADLDKYMQYAVNTDVAGKFAYSFAENGNGIGATIAQDGSILTVPTGLGAGDYTLTITATEKEAQIAPLSVEYGTEPVELTLTVIISRANGQASVTMADYKCGEQEAVNPVPDSDTNGTTIVDYSYKVKDADDETYTSDKPATVGEYTVRAIFGETTNYNAVTVTNDFTVSHIWGDWNITQDPTQTDEGKAEHECTGCEETEEADVPALSDSDVWTPTTRVEPTTENEGSQVYESKFGTVTETLEKLIPSPSPIATPTVEPTATPTTAPTVEPTAAPHDYDYIIEEASVTDGKLQVSLIYHGENPETTAKMIVAAYDDNVMSGVRIFDVSGENIDFGTYDYTLPEGDKIRLFLWNGLDKMIPLARPYDIE